MECEHGQLARACNICEYEREIAVLKDHREHEILAKNKTINLLQTKLSRLTAALNDDERAEKIINCREEQRGGYECGMATGINDYRAELLKEVEK